MKTRNKSFLVLASLVTAAVIFYSCSPAAPKLVPEQKFKPAEKIKAENKNVFRRPTVDILFVIDNSGSMSGHQSRLAQNIALFVDEFSKLKLIDYHIGVISSDDGDGGRLKGKTLFVDQKTPNGLTILKRDLMLGTGGSGTEMMFDPMVDALGSIVAQTYNLGFYREEAYLITIFITDAEDQSYVSGPRDAMNFLVKLKKGDKNKILSFGAIVPSNVNDCERDAFDTPERIEEFLGLSVNTGNNILSLCDNEYGKKLVEFSKSIVTAVNKPIILDQKPSLASIKVFFGTQELKSDLKTGWSFDPKDNSIKFGPELALDESQPSNATIEVTFDAAQVVDP